MCFLFFSLVALPDEPDLPRADFTDQSCPWSPTTVWGVGDLIVGGKAGRAAAVSEKHLIISPPTTSTTTIRYILPHLGSRRRMVEVSPAQTNYVSANRSVKYDRCHLRMRACVRACGPARA
ncbi:hypothetical protein C0Q70_04677 [Pomacea canaliculata]|uniref:Uncharacterized protein n=1 Tax=Pomacea canaliculata TaxID=400727 RepID=A0A2T7PJ16_POMCA|nr:hypothetical protein C0Q70_04677 [Pomacea canaliculata]